MTLETDVAAVVPWEEFGALIEHSVLPMPGGLLEQPHNLWQVLSAMVSGYRREIEHQRKREIEFLRSLGR